MGASLMGKRPPTERHHCSQCGKRLAPLYGTRTIRAHDANGTSSRTEYTGRVLGYGYCGRGLFCGLRCGYAYAVRVAQEKRRAT
jgi:hypothetical protein